MFAGNFAPAGWAFCDGSLLPISDNPTLFQLIGTTYGGDGTNTFALPDLRGRAPMHMGQGSGLTNRTIGEMAGTETVTLTAGQTPVHNHAAAATSSNGNAAGPANAIWAAVTSGDTPYASGNPDTTMAPGALGSAGGSQPHENMQPFVTISFIIALNGTYPSQT
jgi:microcystin-dependent protein